MRCDKRCDKKCEKRFDVVSIREKRKKKWGLIDLSAYVMCVNEVLNYQMLLKLRFKST